jgi:hypothetical protein
MVKKINNIAYSFSCYYLIIYLLLITNLINIIFKQLYYNVFHISKTTFTLIILLLIYFILSFTISIIFTYLENSSINKNFKLKRTIIIKSFNIELINNKYHKKLKSVFSNEKILKLDMLISNDSNEKMISLYENFSSKLIFNILILFKYKKTFKKLTIENVLDIFKINLTEVDDIIRNDLKTSIIYNNRKLKIKKIVNETN